MDTSHNSDLTILTNHRNTWDKKPVLRMVYDEYYQFINQNVVKGSILEIGGGCGNYKECNPGCITCDITRTPWTDFVVDGCSLPFKDGTWKNLVMIDLLHHISDPYRFFLEMDRVLIPGGRIILIEPAITPLSNILLSLTHPEPIDMTIYPFNNQSSSHKIRAFDANQAIPTLIFLVFRSDYEKLFPELQILNITWKSFFVYPLSGGFRSWCLIPRFMSSYLLKIDNSVSGLIGKKLGFRLFVVIEKKY